MTEERYETNPPLWLITGGISYIGSPLIMKLLEEGCRVRVLDCLMHKESKNSVLCLHQHSHFEFINGDLRDPQVRQQALRDSVQGVVHLAAIVGDEICDKMPEEQVRAINVEMTRQLASEAIKRGIRRFIFASTSAVYGQHSEGEADENQSLNPVSLYAKTKIEAEKALLDLYHVCPETFAPSLLRFGTVFGLSGRMRWDLLVHSWSKEAREKGVIEVFGPESWRPYIHVRDITETIWRALTVPVSQIAGQVLNVCKENLTKHAVARLIRQVMPATRIEICADKGDPRSYRISSAKMRHLLQYTPSISVEEGIQELMWAFDNGLLEPSTASLSG